MMKQIVVELAGPRPEQARYGGMEKCFSLAPDREQNKAQEREEACKRAGKE
jgi:hypothetical protein